jgi:intergrase/recombinase
MSRLAQSGNAIDDFWRGFESFLKQTNNHRSTRDRLNYARRYIHTLQQADGSELLELSPEKRIHAMKSIAALAKYIGCYDRWQQIRQKFQLKWSSADPAHDFSLILNNGKDLNYMIKWLKDTHSRLPRKYANMLLFNTLTGLRPSEACTAIGLIHTDSNNYINRSNHTLEHFRYPCFIRRTKKAYISIYNDKIIEVAKDTRKDITYSFLKYLFRKYGLSLNTSFCRKIFGTYLRLRGIEQETIDLLQGRSPKSVFARHYFRPNFTEEKEKVTVCLDDLYREINTASQCCIL